MDISINYEYNIDQAIEVLEEVCASFQEDVRFKDGPNAIGLQSFGSSDIVLRVVGQTENGLQWECERDMRKQIKQTLDNKGIELSLPHQVIFQK